MVGTIDLQQLAKYSCSNDRMLLSCYGDIFDVSSRPDLYGWGPKSWQAGKDITWSVVTGKEKPDQCNRFWERTKSRGMCLKIDETPSYGKLVWGIYENPMDLGVHYFRTNPCALLCSTFGMG